MCIFLSSSRIVSVVIIMFLILVISCYVVKSLLKSRMMARLKSNPYVDCTVTFPEPMAAIRRPGVRLCLGDPVEVITAVSRYCIPVFTLYTDNKLTKLVQSYASYFHKIKGNDAPDVSVSYLTVPRFILALRVEPTLRALVFATALRVTEG